MEKSVVITFETLYEILRREKSKDDVQKLDGTFFDDVIAYLNDKTDFKVDASKKNDVFSALTNDDIVIQLHNIKKILRELYDRREKKILDMAINKARTNSNLISTACLLEHEKKLFESIVSVLLETRNDILFPILNGEYPTFYKNLNEARNKTSFNVEKSEKLIKFLESVDTFVDSELAEYGPFNANDSAYIPKEIAIILIDAGKAVELTNNSS